MRLLSEILTSEYSAKQTHRGTAVRAVERLARRPQPAGAKALNCDGVGFAVDLDAELLQT